MNTSTTTLYYAPGTCAQAVLIALYEAGADFVQKKLDFSANEQRSPAYLAVNSKGRVPALVTPRGTLTETPALLLYVAQTYPQAQLAPLADPFALAQMQEVNAFLASTVHVAHAHRTRGARWADDEASQAGMRAKVPQNMREAFDLIEKQYLGDKTWILGDQFSVADGYLYTVASWLAGDGVDIAEFPRVAAHTARMRERDSVKKVM